MTQAGYEFDSPGRTYGDGLRLSGIVNLVGAVVSVALMVGAGYWGYRLAVRDVTGVPVIQAIGGAMRERPTKPGGEVVTYAGLSVNSLIGEEGADAPETLALAPRPLDLAPEDFPAVPVAVVEAPSLEEEVDAAVTRALALAMGEPVVATPAVLRADAGPGLARSLRPRPRAAAVFAARLEGVTSVSAMASDPVEIDPSDVKRGTRLAQVGIYDDAEAARADWGRIAGRAGALIEGKARVIEAASSSGRDFFRLRVHAFASEEDARLFCAAIGPGSQRCVPVTQR